MEYLKEIQRISDISALADEYPTGILILSDNQDVLDLCACRNIPVAAFEHDDIKMLSCDHILLDVDEVEDQVFEEIYRRCKNIPLDIAQTKRTYIREFSMEDLDALFELYADTEITRYMEPLFPREQEIEYEQNYIRYIYKMYGYGMWLIFDKITNKLIGRAGIETREETCDSPGMAELGFCISPSRWREGLGFEVCSKIIELAFGEYGITCLVSRCDARNAASRALLEKLNFKFDDYRDDGDCLYILKKE